jgi:hypothetical protein
MVVNAVDRALRGPSPGVLSNLKASRTCYQTLTDGLTRSISQYMYIDYFRDLKEAFPWLPYRFPYLSSRCYPRQSPCLFRGDRSCSNAAAFSIPINLNLGSGVSVDSLNFSVQITPNGEAPALTGALGFTPNSSIATAPAVSGGTSNSIGVTWSGLAPPLSGSPALKAVTGTLPASAASGQTYTIAVTAADESLASIPVPVGAGGNGAINVGCTYLVGDVAPKSSDTAPDFGDGVLNIRMIRPESPCRTDMNFRPQECVISIALETWKRGSERDRRCLPIRSSSGRR